MPRYNYECLDCLDIVMKKYSVSISEDLPNNILEEEVIYETSHPMDPSKKDLCEALICPRCGGGKAAKTFYGTEVTSYIRGYGFRDKAGCIRDMNKFKVIQDDPYSEYRQPGEVDHIVDKLERGGKHDPKTKYFAPKDNSNIEDTVKKVVDSAPPKPSKE